MARRKTLPDSVRAKHSLAERLSTLRAEMFGDRGGPELARRLGLPVRTWYNYEAGVTVPAEVVLKIIEMTSIEPLWLLHGRGPKFRPRIADDVFSGAGPRHSASALLQSALRIIENEERTRRITHVPDAVRGDQAGGPSPEGIVLLEVGGSGVDPLRTLSGPPYLAARAEWLKAEGECRCIRHFGDAMAPILEDGAYVVYAKTPDAPETLEGKLVVAWVNEEPLVRWLQQCGRYALLRSENPAAESQQHFIDLEGSPAESRIRRVLWIATPHGLSRRGD